MKVAIVFRGGVSRIHGRQLGIIDSYGGGMPFINIEPCANSFRRHILDVNKNIQLDIYIHTWNQDLVELLTNLYRPVRILAEDNNLYRGEIADRVNKSVECRINENLKSRVKNFLGLSKRSQNNLSGDFAGISQALAIQKGIDLALSSEDPLSGYDALFIYRPDVLLLKDIDLSTYSMNQITCNSMEFDQGDFHFFIPRRFAEKFSEIFDSPFLGNYHQVHSWIRRYVVDFLKIPYGSDLIKAGIDQEVLRKIKASSISFDQAEKYGLSQSDWDSFEG